MRKYIGLEPGKAEFVGNVINASDEFSRRSASLDGAVFVVVQWLSSHRKVTSLSQRDKTLLCKAF